MKNIQFEFCRVDILYFVRYNTGVMEKYCYKHAFNVRYCDVDFQDELKPSTALSYLEEAACYSADELGFGYQYVKAKDLAFMVTNVCCEFLRPVRLFEKDVHVRTWPLPPTFVTFGREYQLCVGDEVTMNATSRWCLIDFTNGKIASSKRIDNQDYSTYNTERALAVDRWKIPTFKQDEGELRFSIKIANSEYDHNLHVNNTRYADYCFNVFSLEELKEKSLRYFSIAYVKQCHEGDELFFYRKALSKQEYLVQGFNAQGETVVQAEIRFV